MDFDDAPITPPRSLVIAVAIIVLAYLHGPIGAILGELGYKHIASWASSVSMLGTIFGVISGVCLWLHTYVYATCEEYAAERSALRAQSNETTVQVVVIPPPASGT